MMLSGDIISALVAVQMGGGSSVIKTTVFEALKKLTPLCTVELADGWSVGFAYDMDINPMPYSEYSYWTLADGSKVAYRSQDYQRYTQYVMFYLNGQLMYATGEFKNAFYVYDAYNMTFNDDNTAAEPYRYGHEATIPVSAVLSDFRMDGVGGAAYADLTVTYDRTYTSYDESGSVTAENNSTRTTNMTAYITEHGSGFYSYSDKSGDEILALMFDVHKACAKKFGYIT